MALKIHYASSSTCPENSAPLSEVVALEGLIKNLKDSKEKWAIWWGFRVLHRAKTTREGDFIILGPNGNCLVLEAKSPAAYSTGSLCSNACTQVQAQVNSILGATPPRGTQKYKTVGDEIFVQSAIFINTPDGKPKTDLTKRLCNKANPIPTFIGSDSFSNFDKDWKKFFGSNVSDRESEYEYSLALLSSIFGNPGKVYRPISDYLYSLLSPLRSPHAEIFQSIQENPRLFVTGGAGSGKSLMAIAHSHRLADLGEDVLFLCYNKAFYAKTLKAFDPSSSKVTVKLWEDYVTALATAAEVEPLAEDADQKQRIEYYDKDLPTALILAAGDPSLKIHKYDALIVDEAQDHTNEWWPYYLDVLLKDPATASLGIYADPFQRPKFRAGSFDSKHIRKVIDRHTKVQLPGTYRYTEKIYQFLSEGIFKELTKPDPDFIKEAQEALGEFKGSVTGEDTIIKEHKDCATAKKEAVSTIKSWIELGKINRKECLILTSKDPFGKGGIFEDDATFGKEYTAKDATEVSSYTLKDNEFLATSFHKSKGLDARAVIILDVFAPSILAAGFHKGLWIAASRARQYLVIHSVKPVPKT